MVKKMKDNIKKNPMVNPTFGTDPSNPWATKYNVTEATEAELLARYLNSRGVNPQFVTRDTKIAHAKSSEYAKWKSDHIERFAREEVEQIDELAPETLASYVLKTTSKDPKRAEPRKKAMSKLAKIMAKRSFSEAKKPTALEKFRNAADEREKKHAEIEKQSKEKPDMKGAIDRLEKHLNKEETLDELNYDTVKSLYKKRRDDFHGDQVGKKKKGKEVSAKNVSRSISRLTGFKPTQKEEAEQIDEKDPCWDNYTQVGMKKKNGRDVPNCVPSKGVPAAKGYKKEEVEQIDELKKSTVFSWLKKQPVVPEKKPGMTRKDFNKKIKTHNKSWNRALDRLAGYKPTSEAVGISKTKETQFHKKLDTLVHNTFGKRKDELKMKEDAFQDPQAATQMPFDGANTTNDTDMMKKREASKSARIIKSIYKRKNMKEELADWEKEDKSVQTYGKKPKLDMTDKKSNVGENKPEARAVMTGGKTLTGQPRDMVEIDPSMKNRPDRPDTFDKGNPKKSPA